MNWLRNRGLRLILSIVLRGSILPFSHTASQAEAAITYPQGYPFATFDKSEHLHVASIYEAVEGQWRY